MLDWRVLAVRTSRVAASWIVGLSLVSITAACGEITIAGGGEEEDTQNQPTNQCEEDSDCLDKKLSCHASAFCDNGTCSYSLSADACLIGGNCEESGGTPFGDKCSVCDPSTSQSSYTPVSCGPGEMCEPSSGACVTPMNDVVDSDVMDMEVDDQDTSDAGDPDMGGTGVDVPDIMDVGDEGGTGTDVEDTTDTGPMCTTNADCADLAVNPCEGAICVQSTGECTTITLPQGSACSLPGGSSDCFAGSCNADGQCLGEPLSNTACDDGNACTLGDVCQEGQCVGSTKDCNDGNPCTQDTCDSITGTCNSMAWATTGEPIPCDDDNSCTEDDYCESGECVSGTNQCSCTVDEDCVDDGNLCNGTLVCVDVGGTKQCVVAEGSKVVCDLSLDDSCNVTACVPESGACVTTTLTGATCDDGDKCTFADKCTGAGVCVGSAQNCNDNDVCTDDSCVDGSCVNAPNTSACNDGDPCTTNDGCSGGTCAGTAKVCNDGNLCTADSCQGGTCVFKPVGGNACDDGNHCTTADTCTCSGTDCATSSCAGTAIVCNDNNICTSDLCDSSAVPPGYNPGIPQSACTFAPLAGACSDGNACTLGDTCQNGSCQPGTGTPACKAGACETASCNPATGCEVTPQANGTPCDDGNECTADETCTGGSCGGGTAICTCTTDNDCDDNNPCNGVETCGDAPGGGKACKPGTPVVCPASGSPCLSNLCNPTSGECEKAPANDGASCGEDDACLISKQCSEGSCKGTEVPCPTVACQTPTGCDPIDGCSYTPVAKGTACSDGSSCTKDDACNSNGACVGTPIDCDDGKVCTADSCSPSSGCKYEPISNTSCEEDGNPCTQEACTAGVCTEVAQVSCDDGVPCTIDQCDSGTGKCTFTPDPGLCDDGNTCTQDTCSPTSGCTYSNTDDFIGCDDENEETKPDFCFQGSCVGGAVVVPGPKNTGCAITERAPIDFSVIGNAYYVLETYTVGKAPSCLSPTPRFVLQALTAGGKTLTNVGTTGADMTALSQESAVGFEGSIAYFEPEAGEYKFDNDLRAAAEEAGISSSTDLHTTSRLNTSTGVAIEHVLLGGRQGNKARGAYCSRKVNDAWGCAVAEFNGGPGPEQQGIVGSVITSRTDKCATIPCIPGTVFNKAWFFGETDESNLEGYIAKDDPFQYEHVLTIEGYGKNFRGAVAQSPDVIWIYGTVGLLWRCEESECQSVSTTNKIAFLDAMTYGDNLVVLTWSSLLGYQLRYLPSGADPVLEAFQVIDLEVPSEVTLTELAGTTTTGIYLLGNDGNGSALVVVRFLK